MSLDSDVPHTRRYRHSVYTNIDFPSIEVRAPERPEIPTSGKGVFVGVYPRPEGSTIPGNLFSVGL